MIKDSVFNEIKNNLNHPANILLRQNDLFRWEPQSPTRIFYSIADDQVPFMNCVVARDSMTARGASSLLVADLNLTANHSGCINPSLTQTIFFFFAYQKVTSVLEKVMTYSSVRIFPNPATDLFNIDGLERKGETIYVFDGVGKSVYSSINKGRSSTQKDFSGITSGLYFVTIQSP